MPAYNSVAIYGVGLIGGAIGLRLRQRGLAGEVVGVGRSEESLARAQAAGAVDRTTTDVAEGVREADVVVMATPVSRVVEHLIRVAEACENPRLLTDAGSTKGEICSRIEQRLPPDCTAFVGSHPLAGSHQTGVLAATADLFEGRVVVVTPTESTPKEVVAEADAFWDCLGARVVHMSPEEHDRTLAATSHLPHLIASALAASTREEDLPLTATGWADTTRVAAGDPGLWTDIFAQNRTAMLKSLAVFQEMLETLRGTIEQSSWEELKDRLEQAKRIRDAVGD